MKVHVDRDACQGHNRCFAAFPDLFDVDEDAKAFVRVDDVSDEWREKAESAARNCPERAISIEP